MGFSPGFPKASAKAQDQSRNFLGALKRSFPRINAGAPTRSNADSGPTLDRGADRLDFGVELQRFVAHLAAPA